MALDKIKGSEYKVKGDKGETHTFESYIPHSLSMKKSAKSKALKGGSMKGVKAAKETSNYTPKHQ